MKQHKLKLFVWSLLATVVLLALTSFLQSGSSLIGKSYVDREDFKSEMDNFYNYIGPAILNPLNAEEVKKSIVVFTEEIEEHRNRYGTLSDQIANIYDQYEARIIEAKDVDNKALEEALTKERDTKIADIQANFESDEHIEEKIKAEKGKEVDRYLAEIKQSIVSNFPIAYELKDTETGKTFSSGNISVPAAYKKQFNERDGFLKASSIPSSSYNTSWSNYDYDRNLWDILNRRNMDEAVTEVVYDDQYDIENSIKTFEGVVVVSKAELTKGNLGRSILEYNKMKYTSYTLWIFGLLSAIVLFTVHRFRKEWVTATGVTAHYDQMKYEIKIIILFITLFMITEYAPGFSNKFVRFLLPQYGFVWWIWLVQFVLLSIAIAFLVFQLVNIVERWKDKDVYLKDTREMYTTKGLIAIRDMFLNRTIGVQMFILLIGFFLAGIGFIAVAIEPSFILAYVPLVLLFGLPAIYIFIRRAAYLNRIIVATEQMAAGRLHDEIKVEGKSPLAKHAQNLNNLREGVRSSMSEQAKSERLKTELITNVSHDLRTPLTSIITYTDLLKNEGLPVEERAKYVDILDKKSQRLKTLIEDLFEVSKMASGNLELNKQRVDLTQLLQQALGEHEEQITETGLDFRVSYPETALIAFIDGKRWWRVFDNLIVNAIKYTLPGTRVYMTLQSQGNEAEFVVKNITKYELGENTDELFERFKRADTSRNTEGSGLGLAIAQSIVDMHSGVMKIDVDGDLFKVTVTVPLSY